MISKHLNSTGDTVYYLSSECTMSVTITESLKQQQLN